MRGCIDLRFSSLLLSDAGGEYDYTVTEGSSTWQLLSSYSDEIVAHQERHVLPVQCTSPLQHAGTAPGVI